MRTSVRVRQLELLVFAVLIAVFSGPVLFGSVRQSMIFQPAAVCSGEWWRLITHPFVHVTWYHLLLDGAAFLLLYHGLLEATVVRRLGYVAAGGAGSLLLSWLAAGAVSDSGLCGLSGIAHGLMAVSALELLANPARSLAEIRMGIVMFAAVVGKAAIEAITGQVFFEFLHFGLVGAPVAVSHAGGIVGCLAVVLCSQTFGRTRLNEGPIL